MAWRYRVREEDRAAVRELVAATGFFSEQEQDVAVELVENALAHGSASEYRFVLADACDGLQGYTCYGPVTPGAAHFDLYWIVVSPDWQRAGIGRALLEETERLSQLEGAAAVTIDTAGRAQYAPTRAFYERMGYRVREIIPDFYSPGDDKVVYHKAFCHRVRSDEGQASARKL